MQMQPFAPSHTVHSVVPARAQGGTTIPAELGDGGAAANEYLAFRLGALDYAVDIMDVQEIRSYAAPACGAGPGDGLPGVLRLRGRSVPVVDLRQRLNLPGGVDGRTVIMVMNLLGSSIGVVVDAVSDVVALLPDDIRPVPVPHDSADTGLFQGLVCSRDAERERTLIIMDLQQLLPQPNALPMPAGAFLPAGRPAPSTLHL